MRRLVAGDLRHKVTLQSLGERTDDSMGGGTIPYTDEATVYAAIEPISGDEILEASQEAATLTHRVRTRYVAGVRPHWRVLYGSRIFDIDRVIDFEERHRELELLCTEQVTW